MERFNGPAGARVSYEKYGSGPPLVLVHGGFSDHVTNWEFIKPAIEQRFTVYAVARRGRGETDATVGHTMEDEANDVAALIRSIGQPVFLVGHSYGAQCALAVALLVPNRIRKLVAYEGPWPTLLHGEALARLEAFAADDNWDELAVTFFRDTLLVPAEEVSAVRDSALWPPIVEDAKATLGDLRALTRYRFDPERWRTFAAPVLLQIGSESPRHLYITDAMASMLPDVRIGVLRGQAHEGMTTAPEQYVESLTAFLLADEERELVQAGASVDAQ